MISFDELGLNVADATLQNRDLYFSNTSFNGLFKVNMCTLEMFYLGSFPKEKYNQTFLHKRSLTSNNKIFFFPSYASSIHVYDIGKNEISAIPFMKEKDEAIIDVIQIGINFYIFPKRKECKPYILNSETYELSTVSGFDTEMDRLVDHENTQKFYRAFRYEDCLYFSINRDDYIGRWNIKTKEFSVIKTGFHHIVNIYIKNDQCYFTTSLNYNVNRLDLNTGKVVEYKISMYGDICDRNPYGGIFEWNDSLILVPSWGDVVTFLVKDNFETIYSFGDTKKTYKFMRGIGTNQGFLLLPLGYSFHKGLLIEQKGDVVNEWNPKLDTLSESLLSDYFFRESKCNYTIVQESKLLCLQKLINSLR